MSVQEWRPMGEQTWQRNTENGHTETAHVPFGRLPWTGPVALVSEDLLAAMLTGLGYTRTDTTTEETP